MTTHAIERAKERANVDLTDEDLATIRAKIGAGRAILLGQAWGWGNQRWIVTVRGKALRVVFNMPNQAVVTVLPGRTKQSPKAARHRGRA